MAVLVRWNLKMKLIQFEPQFPSLSAFVRLNHCNVSVEREEEEVFMVSMAFSATRPCNHLFYNTSGRNWSSSPSTRIYMFHEPGESKTQMGRRELILKSSEIALIGAIFHFSGTKPSYLGVQKNPPALALCPATKNCISTSEDISDLNHYAPPWNYNPEGGRRRKKPASREEAMDELIQAIKSTKPDKFTPRIMDKKDDYLRVEYESPIMGFVDDVEFWFPPGKKSIVEYRSASRIGNFDFDVNKKRIKALRLELERQGWASEGAF